LALPDHFDFSSLPWPSEAIDVIVTEKDAVKLKPERVGSTRVWVAPLNFELRPASQAALLALLSPSP
jgi:tetraacyldisaccharide 4'-kinase